MSDNHGMLMLGTVAGPYLAHARDSVRQNTDQFGLVDFREKFAGSPHEETQTIFLRAPAWPLTDLTRLQDDLQVVNWPLLQIDARWPPILFALQELSGLEMARAMIVRLNPGGIVSEHTDQGLYADSTERFHWVIETNDGVASVVDNEEFQNPPGSVWWLDKTRPHGAANTGKTPRIHLIFDGWRKPG